jgi:hypothetical protein
MGTFSRELEWGHFQKVLIEMELACGQWRPVVVAFAKR